MTKEEVKTMRKAIKQLDSSDLTPNKLEKRISEIQARVSELREANQSEVTEKIKKRKLAETPDEIPDEPDDGIEDVQIGRASCRERV